MAIAFTRLLGAEVCFAGAAFTAKEEIGIMMDKRRKVIQATVI